MANNNTHQVEDEISRVFNNPDIITKAIQKAINAALLKHKQAGNPVCEWRNDKVVWIAPEEINVK